MHEQPQRVVQRLRHAAEGDHPVGQPVGWGGEGGLVGELKLCGVQIRQLGQNKIRIKTVHAMQRAVAGDHHPVFFDALYRHTL